MNRLINLIKSLVPSRHINKTTKEELKEVIIGLDVNEHKETIQFIDEILKSQKYTKKLKNKFKEKIENNEEITEEDINQVIIETIVEIDDENLEKELDEKCERYMKFTESNPAEHIKYDKTNKNYILVIGKTKNTSNNVKKLKDKLHKKYKDDFQDKFQEFVLTKNFSYKNKKIIVYITNNNKKYFDINHVLNLVCKNNKNDKYLEYKDKIKLFDFRDNKYDGFYIKEFIDQETFYNMMLHSNNVFAQQFKNELAPLLDKLTNVGSLIIKDGKLDLNIHKQTNESKITSIENRCIYNQTFDNVQLTEFIKQRIENIKITGWNKYIKRNIMYCFITNLKDPYNHNRILCKIGYTYNLINRIISLKKEYTCKFYLIGLKLIESENDEKEFHKLLKTKFPEFVIKYQINDKDKDEIYVFDLTLYKEFIEYKEKQSFDEQQIILDKESEDVFNDYYNNLIQVFELELVQKSTKIMKIENINNQFQQQTVIHWINNYYEHLKIIEQNNLIKFQEKHKYDFDELKEKNRHIELIKDKDIKLKELEIEQMKLNH